MNNLTKKELNEVKGGGIGTYLLIGGIIVFIIGIVDGYVRPLKCNR
ncbi:MAG TPA: bacteriocin [Bacilli bacterium]|nr:bacteriocin [Bacilli bacterium]